MNDHENPFKKFIVDSNEPLDKHLVSEIIESYVENVGRNRVISYTKPFERSPAWLKISIYLCCRKVMLDQGIVNKEEVGPKEISGDTGIDIASAKNVSRDTNLKGIVSKAEKGYFIPNHRLRKLKEAIEAYGRKNRK